MTLSYFLEQIRMEHMRMKSSLDSKLQIDPICSIRIPSRNQDIIRKLNLKKVYAIFDKDGDQKLSQKEFIGVMADRFARQQKVSLIVKCFSNLNNDYRKSVIRSRQVNIEFRFLKFLVAQ